MRKLAILGAGESGVGAALLAQKKGFEVWLSDRDVIQDSYRDDLQKNAIPYEEGGHTEEKILSADEIIKSPGIPDKAAIVKAAQAKGIPVISEIEFAGRYAEGATIVGITGSNGKTTTTKLVYHLLKTAGFDVAMGGNVGHSFARLIVESPARHYVLELSSFQLDGITTFRPNVAILLNISPDHLDRYDYEMKNYVASKFRIAMNQTPGDLFIYNAADDEIAIFLAQNHLKSKMSGIDRVVFENGKLCVDKRFFDISKSQLRGWHNMFNATAAIMAVKALGAKDPLIESGLKSFQMPAHRLEFVAEVDGVEYINDSKATNVDAVFYALQAMEKPVIWIVGGLDKGNDYKALARLVEEKVKTIICLGADNTKIVNFFSGMGKPIVETRSAKQAVAAAFETGKTGDVVLLSPACASFDLFKNYEDRGDQFKVAVMQLKK